MDESCSEKTTWISGPCNEKIRFSVSLFVFNTQNRRREKQRTKYTNSVGNHTKASARVYFDDGDDEAMRRCLPFVRGSKRISSQNHFMAVFWTITTPSLMDLAVVFTALATLKF